MLVARRKARLAGDSLGAVGREQRRAHRELALDEIAQHRDRAVARAAEGRQQGAFGKHLGAARGMVDCRQPFARRPVVGPAFDGDDRLGRRRQPVVQGQRMADPELAEPLEARGSEKGRLNLPRRELGEARSDVAAKGHDPAIGPRVEQLRRAPRGAGADHRVSRQRVDRGRADQHVALVRPRQDGRDRQLGRPDRLDVLERVDRGIDPPFAEPDVELARPQRLAADLRQRPVLDLVPARLDRHQLDSALGPAVRGAEAPARLFGLRHGKRGTAGAQSQRGGVTHRPCLP